MNKIVLINFFIGKYPWYINIFLNSCKFNPDIDFILFTDNEVENLPSNVKIHYYDINLFNELASKKIGFRININRAYKACDFKPSFGVIFEDYITQYDFWGVCDVDLVFGQIRDFITEDILSNDIISARHDYVSGFFFLFKNTSYINNLFRLSKDYKLVFTSQLNHCFDECNYKYKEIYEPKDILKTQCNTESILSVIVKEQLKGNLKAHFDFMIVEGTPGNLKWDKGYLTYKNEYHCLLYHLISYKNNVYSIKKRWNTISDKFYIDKYCFRKRDGYISNLKSYLINSIYPSTVKKAQKIDRLLSMKFYKKKISDLKEGDYYLGETKCRVIKNQENSNLIDFIKEGQFLPVHALFFHRKLFYLDGIPFFFKYPRREGNEATNFKIIGIDGNINIFYRRNTKSKI